jgi:protein-tyrosine kinase
MSATPLSTPQADWSRSESRSYAQGAGASPGVLGGKGLSSRSPAFSRASPDDQVRSLRTQLLLRHERAASPCDLMAVISADHGDAHSRLVADLGRSFANAGQSTLIIDADVREPQQHRLFHQDLGPGLVEALQQRQMPQLRPLDGAGRLSLLTAGGPLQEPDELFSTPFLETLLADYSKRFERILIDTPVAGTGADAFTLSALARRVLLVARRQRTAMSGARELLYRLERNGVEVIGSVLCDC